MVVGTKDGVTDDTMVAGGSVGGVAVGGKKALVTARQAKVARRSAAADSPMTVFLCFMTYEIYTFMVWMCFIISWSNRPEGLKDSQIDQVQPSGRFCLQVGLLDNAYWIARQTLFKIFRRSSTSSGYS